MAAREVWKPSKRFPGYDVSTLGNVRSYWQRRATQNVIDHKADPKPIVPSSDPEGRRYVTLFNKGKATNCPLARLVLTAFDRAPRKGEIVGYKDTDVTNCAASNLFWTTRAAAAAAAKARGVPVGQHKNVKAGVIKMIRRKVAAATDAAGNLQKGVIAALVEKTGLSKSTIANIARGTAHADVA